MKKIIGILSLALLSTVSSADEKSSPHWSYGGAEGPEYWGELSPNYDACKTGKNQSPVNLTHFTHANLEPITFNYVSSGNEVVNNGHTIQENYQPGSNIVVDGKSYDLKQFHFHSPSENQINGKSYPLEAHLVHQNKDGKLAVIGIMFDEGEQSTTLKDVWANMPHQPGKHKVDHQISVKGLLPENKDYYRFNGSLTTPPCTEGVLWMVLKQPMTVSSAQVKDFTHTMHHTNNRPIQPINARMIID